MYRPTFKDHSMSDYIPDPKAKVYLIWAEQQTVHYVTEHRKKIIPEADFQMKATLTMLSHDYPSAEIALKLILNPMSMNMDDVQFDYYEDDNMPNIDTAIVKTVSQNGVILCRYYCNIIYGWSDTCLIVELF